MVSQLLSALKSNRKKQVQGYEFYRAFGDLKVTLNNSCENAEDEKQERGVGKIRYQYFEIQCCQLKCPANVRHPYPIVDGI